MERFAELIQLAHEGDKNARDRLVSENLGLVHAIVRRFDNRGHDREELFQTGCIGLIKAIDKFDLSLRLAFSTYAVPVITGEIRRFLRDDGPMKVSRSLKENACKIYKAKEMLCRELGREPVLAEVSAATELSVEEIVMAMEAGREVASLYQPVCEKDGDELLMLDRISGSERDDFTTEEPEKEAVLNHMLIEQLLSQLDSKEKRLLELRYFESRTQTETAAELHMTQVQVSRLEKKLLLRLRENI